MYRNLSIGYIPDVRWIQTFVTWFHSKTQILSKSIFIVACLQYIKDKEYISGDMRLAKPLNLGQALLCPDVNCQRGQMVCIMHKQTISKYSTNAKRSFQVKVAVTAARSIVLSICYGWTSVSWCVCSRWHDTRRSASALFCIAFGIKTLRVVCPFPQINIFYECLTPTSAGVPNLSLTMYPFSIPTDEHIPLQHFKS